MAQLDVQKITLGLDAEDDSYSGLTPTFDAADEDGDTFRNDGNTFLVVKNGDDASMTVTVRSRKACNQGHSHNVKEVTVPAAVDDVPGEVWLGRFDAKDFNDESSLVDVEYSAVTDVKVGVFSLAERSR